MPAERRDLALYIHWPFCASKCPYCDFNSHVRDHIDQTRWRNALIAAIDRHARQLGPRRLVSLFFGGGTPSLMPPDTVAAVIDRAAAHWPPAAKIEITLEANPTSVEAARFADLAAAGVNRVSLGLQSLEDGALAFLGRTHTAGEGRHALETAQRQFARTSFDLIYARPGQTEAQWDRELSRALGLAGDLTGGHLSLYQLAFEPGTPFFSALRQGEIRPLDEERQAALYTLTQERCTAAGLPAYEISNHARPGDESRHNLVYWRYGDYLGLGPGAHSRLRDPASGRVRASREHRLPERWLKAAESGKDLFDETDQLSAEQEAEERLMMGLRLREGVDLDRFERDLGPLEDYVDCAQLAAMIEGGYLSRTARRLRVPDRGRLVLNTVLGALLAAGDRSLGNSPAGDRLPQHRTA